MKKIGVLTSGGDSPGMNACIRAVVRCGIDKGLTVMGIRRGFEGLLDGEIFEMSRSDVGDILHRGGTVLMSARSKRFMEKEYQEKAAEMLRTFGIEGLIVIGGDGSLNGGRVLSDLGIKVMGLPGTIDNDLGYTDFTIGFDTAVSTVLDAISKVRDTSSAHDRTSVIEVMGRECGDIALYSGVAGGAESVLIPEVPEDLGSVYRKIIEGSNRGKKHSIIIKAEGTKTPILELVKLIEEHTNKETKPIVLSYLQRGGTPTANDRMLATLCGEKAIDLLANDSESKAIGMVAGEIVAYDLREALTKKRELKTNLLELIDVLSK